MHLCQDEINALVSSLPFLEHLTRHVRNAWCWMYTRLMRRLHRSD